MKGSRQEAVVQMLILGFGTMAEEAAVLVNGVATLRIAEVGTFTIAANGDLTVPDDLNPDLQYWISVDLTCLDMLRAEEVDYHPEVHDVLGDW